jgi:hypothetical protein
LRTAPFVDVELDHAARNARRDRQHYRRLDDAGRIDRIDGRAAGRGYDANRNRPFAPPHDGSNRAECCNAENPDPDFSHQSPPQCRTWLLQHARRRELIEAKR